MQTEKFTVQNVKCGGCVSAIQEALKAQPGVSEVEVVIDSGEVSVTGDNLDRAALSAKLAETGYPEA